MNNRKLLLILLAVVGVYFLASTFSKRGTQKNFKTSLYEPLDSMQISGIVLNSMTHGEIQFSKKGNEWIVSQNGVEAEVPKATIDFFMREFDELKTMRLGSKSKSQWPKYQLNDSTGIRLQIFEASKNVVDMYIGKFNFDQAARSASTYVRLASEDESYVVNGAPGLSLNRPFNSWRKLNILTVDPNSVAGIDFIQGENQPLSFSKEGQWISTQGRVDSTKVMTYIQGISTLQGENFVDGFDVDNADLICEYTVRKVVGDPVVIKLFSGEESDTYVLHSSENPKSYFSIGKDAPQYQSLALEYDMLK